MRQRIENCVRNFLTRRSLTEMKVWYDNKSECFFGYCWNMLSRFGFGINERSLNSNYFTSCRSYSSRFNGSLIRDLIDLLRMKISIIRRVWLLLLNRKMGDSSKLMGAAAAILAAFLALAGAAWSLDLPDVLCFNLFIAIYWIFLYLSIYIEIRWWVYERTKEWIKISGRFKSIQYFFILFSVYTALAVIPSDLFVGSSVAGFFGRFLGSEGTAIMTTTCVSLLSIFSICIYLSIGLSLIFLLFEIGLFLLRVRNYQRTTKEKMALVFQYLSIRLFFIILKPFQRLLVYFFYSILVRFFSGVWELDFSFLKILLGEFDLTKYMVNSSMPDKAVILYKAPSPGGAVEIFEVSTTSSDLSGGTPANEGASTEFRNLVEPGPELHSQPVAQPGPQPEPSDPLSIRERGKCDSIKTKICELPPIRDELEEVERSFPGITTRLAPSKAIDLIMNDIITSEQARRGIEQGATHKDIYCYKNWLSRVKRGTDPTYPPVIPQPRINDIDIQGKIIAFYRKHSSNGGGGG